MMESRTYNRNQINYDVKVPIKDEYLSILAFSLKTRRGMAVVLSWFGDCEQIGDFMQNCSHKTRAYYVNANGLPGFVMPFSIAKYLERPEVRAVNMYQ